MEAVAISQICNWTLDLQLATENKGIAQGLLQLGEPVWVSSSHTGMWWEVAHAASRKHALTGMWTQWQPSVLEHDASWNSLGIAEQ